LMSQARCHSPTSATDISDSSTQIPIAQLPSPQLCSRSDRLPSAHPEPPVKETPNTWGSTASDHRSPPFDGTAIRPRVRQRLTTPPQLQPDRSPFSPALWGRIWAQPEGRGHLDAAFSAAIEAEDQTSDAPVALRELPELFRFFSQSQGPLPPPSRQQERLSRPGAPFIDKCVAHIRRHRPPPVPSALPPRSGFRRSFAPPMLSHERARSSSITRAIRPGSRGPRAACRLLQSKRSLSTAA